MAHVYTEEQNYQDIANAIREKNGTDTQYLPSEMAEAIGELPIGLDFTEIGYPTSYNDEYVAKYQDAFEYAKYLKNKFESEKNLLYSDRTNPRLVLFPQIDTSQYNIPKGWLSSVINMEQVGVFDLRSTTTMQELFNCCYSLQKIQGLLNLQNIENMQEAFYRCQALQTIGSDFNFETINNTTLYNAFVGCRNLRTPIKLNTDKVTEIRYAFQECRNVPSIELTSIELCSNFTYIFYQIYKCETVHFERWKQGNIDLQTASILSAESVNYIIEYALGVDDGATARTLSLTSTTKTNWQNSEDYEYYQAMASEKLITIA